MQGTAYGAVRDGSTVAVLDVRSDGERLAVSCEPRMADDIAEEISAATSWDDLPIVRFESWQVLGEGR